MQYIETEIRGSEMWLNISGRVDSSNAAQIGDEIDKALAGQEFDSLVIDADKLEYISSAGLRLILKLRKQTENTKIINASSEVYDILDMTGFTEMIKVEKAYRRITVDGCEVIGEGANGKVYRLDEETIIKVYKSADSLPDIHRERELARRAFVLGIPTAIPYDVVKVGDNYGSVFELLSADSFSKLIARDSAYVDKYIDYSVSILKKMHTTEVSESDMPDSKEKAINKLMYLEGHIPDDKYKKLLDMAKEIPNEKFMIHGDYHVKNLMMQKDEVLLIDMDTLSYGNKIFEFAGIYNAYKGFASLRPNKGEETFLGIPQQISEIIWQKTLECYFEGKDKAYLDDIENKSKVMGYAWLLRRSIKRGDMNNEEDKKKVEICKNNLFEALDKIDNFIM